MIVEQTIHYEQGLLNREEISSLFQKLVDTNLVQILPGWYTRKAESLIREGLVVSPNTSFTYRIKIQNPSSKVWHTLPLRFSSMRDVKNYRASLSVPSDITTAPRYRRSCDTKLGNFLR